MKPALVLSCEHGGNRVPARYRRHFLSGAKALASHEGHDLGAATLARQLAAALDAKLFLATTTRLLADPNRSASNRAVFSRFTRDLPAEERERIVADCWRPHREAVEGAVRAFGRRRTLHLSVHTFTPVWEGVERELDVALLYDPARRLEREFAGSWLAELRSVRADHAGRAGLRLGRNRPYRGTSDGLTTHLRRLFPPGRYLGVELEVSQRFPLGQTGAWRELRGDLIDSLRVVLG